MSARTAEHMTWHQSHDAVDGVMVHPSNGEAWKHFNSMYPHFSAKSRNMHLGLCTNNSTNLGHLLLLILVGRSYSWFITCHHECV
jgi:hypothetical protein